MSEKSACRTSGLPVQQFRADRGQFEDCCTPELTFEGALRNFEGANLPLWAAEPALCLRSVCWITTAFDGLKCHPLTCMWFNLRLSVDSIPTHHIDV
jgi:hypothetical protein